MTRQRPAVIARDTALAGLTDLLRRAGEGDSCCVLVGGKAGVGKTTLVDEFAARHEGPVLRAAAAPWEARRSYGVLDQLAPRVDTGGDPVEVAERLRRHLDHYGDTVLVIVDDAQWTDPESLQVLGSAVRHHTGRGFLVVASAVIGDPTVPGSTLELLQHISSAVFALEPFTAAEVGELAAVHGIVLHPAMAERLQAHTGGMPRHVMQLLIELPRSTWERFDPDLPAPALVAGRVKEILERCSARARTFAEAVAVLGPGTAVHDAARLAGIDDDVLAVVDEAVDVGLVVLGPRGLTEVGPADPMVRAAVLAAMGPAAASALRRQAAELVDDPLLQVRLLVAATPVPDSALADRLDRLAVERAAEGAWGAAAGLLWDSGRLTEERLPRESRLTRAVDALIGAGDVLGAAALVPAVESLRETPLRNAVLGYLAIVRGRPTEAENRLGRAWDLVNSRREPDVAALICQRYVLHALCRCRPEELVTWADRAIGLVGADTPAAVEAAAIRGIGLAYRDVEAARHSYENLGQHVRRGAQVQRVAIGRGWVSLIADAIDDARVDFKMSVPTTFLGGSTRISLWARAWLARVRFLTGDWEDALRIAREATELIDRTGMVLLDPLVQWTVVAVHTLRGEWEQADSALRRADAGPQDYEIMRVPSLLARAQWAEARADAAGVLRVLRPLTEPWARGNVDDPGQWPWADLYAHALIAEGRYDEADRFLAKHERRAAELGRISAQARLGGARGYLLGVRGDLDGAREAFETALGLLDELPLRYDRARVTFSYGQILRRAGKRREADAEFTAARDIFVALGARTYVIRCDREHKAGGVRVHRLERAVDALTPQEEAVAELVARGMSNREVAAELFVSTKTIQYHLTRIYSKLGIRSRVELAALRNSPEPKLPQRPGHPGTPGGSSGGG
ncbi:LuxR C-terminal-related transcriptional regulator [Nocardia sp. R7R-8]|uniref:LuxR C-terminal-related transcriptional regulator n=1 Tax=Nocardia sp. R7R-8 TaxID=3459304 RepID=UPI00403E16BD